MTGNLVVDCMRELVDGALFYTLCGQPGSIIDSNVLIYSGKYQVGGNFFYMDGGSSYFTVKRNVTIGCSYTFGMGNGAKNMIIDSNWAEWQNYWTSNDGVSPGANGMIVTNMSFSTPPQAIIDRAGVHDDEVKLTELVSMAARKPVKQFAGISLKEGKTVMFDTRGRRVAVSQGLSKNAVTKGNYSSGVYLMRRNDNALTLKRVVVAP
jgi:hypothetical protein